jgi:hypothetical protein
VHGAALSADKPLMRSSKSQVRRARLRDGSLVARLRASDSATVAATLAKMSAHYTKIAMPDVGRSLLRASFRAGLAWPDQRPAARAAVLAATPDPIKAGAARLRRAPRALVRRVRRLGRRIVGPR